MAELPKYEKHWHAAEWRWDNPSAMYRCVQTWPNGQHCNHVDAGYLGMPGPAQHVIMIKKVD